MALQPPPLDQSALNDPPINSGVTAKIAIEDTNLAIAGVSVGDPDAGSNPIRVTLSVAHGTLTLLTNVTNGVTAGQITGNGTGTVTITGSQTQINTTLDAFNGLIYRAQLNFNGADTLTVTSNDQGWSTGSVGGSQDIVSKQDVDSASITVSAVNDAPVLENAGPTASLILPIAAVLDPDLTVSDVDLDALNGGEGNYAGATLSVLRQGGANSNDVFGFNLTGASFIVSGGNLQAGGQTFATFTNSGGALTITFTSSGSIASSALVDQVLQHITYTNSNSAPPANVTLSYTFNDGAPAGGQGAGATSAATGAITVAITPATPPAPVITDFNDDNGYSPFDNITKDTDLVIFGDAGSAQPNTLVRLFDGATLLGSTTSAADGSWSIPTGLLGEGPHQFKVEQVTSGGLVSPQSELNVVIDTTPPIQPLITSITDDSGSATGNPGRVVTNDTTPTLHGTSEPNSFVQVWRSETGLDFGTKVGDFLTDNTGNWSFTDTGLVDGEDYFYDLDGYDLAFNGITNVNYQSTIIIDLTAPTSPVDSDSGANSVAEDAISGAVVGIDVNATDATSAVTYSLSEDAGGRFTIDPITGIVTVADASLIDFETAASHQIAIIATDEAGNVSSPATLTVNVTNVAPSAPADTDAAANNISEGAVNGALVGVTASSTDIHGGAVTFSLTDDAGGRFAIDPITGVVTVANAALLNFETAQSHSIIVRGSDGNLYGSTSSHTIAVTNVAPSAPVDGDATSNTVSENAINGATVGVTVASTDVHGGPIGFRLTDDAGGRFAVDPNSGVVTVANAALLDFETAQSHDITVEASDGTDWMSQTFTIAVADGFDFNFVAGTAGKDKKLIGTDGIDRIDGLDRADKMIGLDGDDVYVVSNKNDKVVERPGGGIDTVEASVTVKLSSNVENVILTGNQPINATGNRENNVITGNIANNILDGKGGFDTFVFAGNFGNDTIKNFKGNGADAGDIIRFDNAIFADFDAVLAATTDIGKHLLIDAGGFGTITLKHVSSIGLLHASDFEFV